MEKKSETEQNDLLIGRNAVSEALRNGREINTLLVSKGERNGSIGRILAECKEKNIVIKEVERKKLDAICSGSAHQGVAAFCAAHAYAELDDVFALAQSRGEAPFVIICAELEDPHKLGAILRSAEAGGAHGVIIPKRRSAALNYTVGKASAGAIEYVPVVRVSNLAAAVDELKRRGLWIYCADMGGTNWCEVDYSGGVGLVIGSEGRGVSRLIKEKSDFTVSLPMKGRINSLNASVAAGILIYEVSRQRSGITAKECVSDV